MGSLPLRPGLECGSWPVGVECYGVYRPAQSCAPTPFWRILRVYGRGTGYETGLESQDGGGASRAAAEGMEEVQVAANDRGCGDQGEAFPRATFCREKQSQRMAVVKGGGYRLERHVPGVVSVPTSSVKIEAEYQSRICYFPVSRRREFGLCYTGIRSCEGVSSWTGSFGHKIARSRRRTVMSRSGAGDSSQAGAAAGAARSQKRKRRDVAAAIREA